MGLAKIVNVLGKFAASKGCKLGTVLERNSGKLEKIEVFSKDYLKKNKKQLAATFLMGLAVGGYTFKGCSSKDEPVPQQEKTQPAKKQSAKKPAVKKDEKPKFNYVPPKIGEQGITSADTTYFAGSKNIRSIYYNDAKGRTAHITNFTKDGKLKGFTINDDLTDPDGKSYSCFNEKGELVERSHVSNDKKRHIDTRTEHGNSLTEIYDAKGRLIEYESEYYICDDIWGIKRSTFKYNADGSYEINSDGETASVYDKNDKLLKEKHYKSDGALDYTVIPRYNKENDIVKRDTIRTE